MSPQCVYDSSTTAEYSSEHAELCQSGAGIAAKKYPKITTEGHHDEESKHYSCAVKKEKRVTLGLPPKGK